MTVEYCDYVPSASTALLRLKCPEDTPGKPGASWWARIFGYQNGIESWKQTRWFHGISMGLHKSQLDDCYHMLSLLLYIIVVYAILWDVWWLKCSKFHLQVERSPILRSWVSSSHRAIVKYPLVNKHSYWKLQFMGDLLYPLKIMFFSIVMLVYRRVIPYNITPQEWLGTHEGAAKSIPSLDTPACPCVRILPHCWKTWSWLVECWAASSPRQKSWAVRMLGRFYIHLFERHRQSFHAYRTRTQRHTKKHHTHTYIYI